MTEALNLANVIESEHRLALLETEQPERVVEYFKRLTLTTGRAVYGWSPNDGLYRLGSERIFIPYTRTVADALSYVAASRHYGIYVLRGISDQLSKNAVKQALARILNKADDTRRLVIVLDQDVDIPEDLESSLVRIRHNVAAARRAGT